MGSMSYCAFENTAGDMHVCVRKLSEMNFEGESIDELDSNEKRGLKNLVSDARELIEIYDAMTEGE